MSAAVLAAPRLRRRSLERTAMTPEQELELLIAEQQRDDTYYVDRAAGEISLDAPTPSGDGTLSDLIGIDEDGDLVVFPAAHLPSSYKTALGAHAPLSNAHQHGTIYAYARLKCRCLPCKGAKAAYERERRAKKRSGQ